MTTENTNVIQQFLGTLHIRVPKAVIRRKLDTPLGHTIRGISDALDAIGIHNEVYQLPKEYLQELEPPFLVSMPRQPQLYHVVMHIDRQSVSLLGEQDMSLDRFLKKWNGVALIAEKTEETTIYDHILLHDIGDWAKRHLLLFIPLFLTIFSFLLTPSGIVRILHIVLCLTGFYVSTILVYREYRDASIFNRYCHIGNIVNCRKVEQISKKKLLLGTFRMCDLSFLFFTIMLLYAILETDGYCSWSIVLLSIGCLFTIYSVILQLVVAQNICLFCMMVNVLVWSDSFLLGLRHYTFSLHLSFPLIISIFLSYLLLYYTRKILMDAKYKENIREKLSHIYQKDLFEFLLSKEPFVEELPDYYAECSGNTDNCDIVSIIIHPKCEACEQIKQYISPLAKNAKVKVFLFDKPQVALYCLQHGISQTPTIMVNGHFLPALYSIEDLIYLL